MGRRVFVSLAAVAVVAGTGYAVYSLFFADQPQPEHVEPPTFVPPAGPLPRTTDDFEQLAKTDPVKMFEACLSRYAGQKVKGFRATLEKRERIAGKLHDPEVVRVTARDEPAAVLMRWEKGGQRDLFGNVVRGTLYAAGENGDQILTYRPGALKEQHWIDLKGSLARGASRYCIMDSGLYRSMLRTYTAWKAKKEAGELTTEYRGKERVERLGGRECYVVRRTCPRPEADSFALDEKPPTDRKVIDRDGFTEVTVMIDAERWLQVGSVLKKPNGDLVGEYYFRDVQLIREDELAAEFPEGTFTVEALKVAKK